MNESNTTELERGWVAECWFCESNFTKQHDCPTCTLYICPACGKCGCNLSEEARKAVLITLRTVANNRVKNNEIRANPRRIHSTLDPEASCKGQSTDRGTCRIKGGSPPITGDSRIQTVDIDHGFKEVQHKALGKQQPNDRTVHMPTMPKQNTSYNDQDAFLDEFNRDDLDDLEEIEVAQV